VVELDLEQDGAEIQKSVKREFEFGPVPAGFVRGEPLGESMELIVVIVTLKEGNMFRALRGGPR